VILSKRRPGSAAGFSSTVAPRLEDIDPRRGSGCKFGRLAAVLISAGLSARKRAGFAQDQNQPSPSISKSVKTALKIKAPEHLGRRKKPAAKRKDASGPVICEFRVLQRLAESSSDSSPAPSSAPAKDENPFPEAVLAEGCATSAKIRRCLSLQKEPSPRAQRTLSPRDVSRARLRNLSPDAAVPSPRKRNRHKPENPFPGRPLAQRGKGTQTLPRKVRMAKSRRVKRRINCRPASAPSRSSDDEDQGGDNSLPGVNADGQSKNTLAVTDPVRAKRDTQVGGFTSRRGITVGPTCVTKTLSGYDPADVEAIFGLAEAARALKLVAEAEQNYNFIWEIVPDGSKAKRAVKALRSLDSQR